MRILLLLVWLFTFTEASAENFKAKVVGVIDGDTITVLKGKETLRVRLWGIDCPERGRPFSKQATKAVAELTFGKIVTLETKGTDIFNRTLALVTPEATAVPANHTLIERGLCWWFQDYVPEEPKLAELERRAREARIGVWSRAGQSVASAKYSKEKSEVIGNKRRRIYHRSDCPSYGDLGPENRIVFADEITAQVKGYRLAGNCKAAAAEQIASSDELRGGEQLEGKVRGNRRSKIFHLPSCPDYNRIAKRNRVEFKSSRAAEEGGYRMAKNCFR